MGLVKKGGFDQDCDGVELSGDCAVSTGQCDQAVDDGEDSFEK